jgi:hypothetical protein
MRIMTAIMLFAAALSFGGCAFGPSGEAQNKQELDDEAATERSEAFSRSLPPAR